MMSENIFHLEHETGSMVQIHKGGSVTHEPCIANIGYVEGNARKIPAILCDGATEQDQWHIVNMTNDQGFWAGHIAIYGAVSESQMKELASRYLFDSATFNSQHALTQGGIGRFLDSTQTFSQNSFFLADDADKFNNQLTQKAVSWDEEKLLSHHGQASSMLFDMVRHDDNGELLAQCTPSEIMAILLDGTEGMLTDAMVIQYKQFDKVIKKLGNALQKQGDQEFFVENVTPISPFKKNNVVNVGAIFEMNDTQTVTVLFNNPDTTPAKLTQEDVLTSWKWTLNKRDVTAALQPKSSDSTRYTLIAKRMMQLLAKNHARFQRASAEKLRISRENDELKALLASKEAELADLDQQLATVQANIDAKALEKQANNTANVQVPEADQTATNITLYRLKSTNPRARKPVGQTKITRLDDGTYNVFTHEGGVGGEFEGSISEIKNWLISRHTPMGTAMSGNASWENIQKRLILESGEDVLNIATTETSTSTSPEPEQTDLPKVPEGFDLQEATQGIWTLKHEELSVFSRILEISKGKYQSKFQSANSTFMNDLDTAVQWSVNIMNEFLQSMAVQNQEEQDLIDNWQDKIPDEFDQEKFKQSFNVVKDDADKKGLNWNDAAIFKFVAQSTLRFMGADKELEEFVNLTSILTNNANTMSRKLYAIYTNGNVVLNGKSSKAVQERMEEYAQEIFTPEQQAEFTKRTKAKQVADVQAQKDALVTDVKNDITSLWNNELKGSQAAILKWMNDGFRPQSKKIGAINRQIFVKDAEYYKPQNNKAYRSLERMIKASNEVYGSFENALIELGAWQKPSETVPEVPLSDNADPHEETRQYLNQVINDEIDLSSQDVGDRLEQIGENLPSELEVLFEQSADAYATFAIENAKRAG